MKLCGECKVLKSFTEFTLRGKSRKGEYQNNCNDCRRLSNRKYKHHNSDLVKRRKMMKGCAQCGFKAEHSVQLDLDHIIPKRLGKSDRQAINTSWSKKRLKEELSKVQVLCANCHRLKTYRDGTMFKRKVT